VGRIIDEDVARVRDATDIVQLVSERVVLKQKSRLFWGCCPFHGEKTPSFKIDPATGLWHCFGCGLGGDVFGFVMRTENAEFPDAVRILADRANIELHEEGGGVPRGLKERLIAANEAAADFYHAQLTKGRDEGSAKARDYLAQRDFGSGVSKRFRLGWSPGRGTLVAELRRAGFSAEELVASGLALKSDSGQLRDRFYERIMFPIHDLQGRCIAFGGRIVGTGEPKYLNSAETPTFSKGRNLYALDRAKASIVTAQFAVVVEGYTDVIALHEAGITNAVATLGTALTREHVKLLGRFARRIVYLFDGDEAGLRAADRAAEFVDAAVTPEAGREPLSLKVVVLPGGQDPADFVAEKGAPALTALMEDAVELLRFAIDRRIARHDLSKPEERERAVREAAAVLAPVKESSLAQDYANYIADRLQEGYSAGMAMVDTARVLAAIGATRPSAPAPDDSQEAGASRERSQALTLQQQVELEVLGMLVSHPDLRPRARELLDEHLLTEPTYCSIAEALASAPRVSDDGLIGVLEERVPGAATVLSAVLVADTVAEDPHSVFSDLARKLKEFDLGRRIREVRRLMSSPSDGGEARLSEDELMQEYTRLTRELEELKAPR